MVADRDPQSGYDRAVALLRECATEDGFIANPSRRDNYCRVWARDGAIMSLAALLTGDRELIDTARRTFETLAAHQGPHGEIPSNVDGATRRVSYGGTTGRVDADLARAQPIDEARRHLQAVHRANSLAMDGEDWAFPEFVYGRQFTPGGTRYQGWSAAGAVIGHRAVAGQSVFRIDDHDI